jgi:hypothetical protein
MTVKKLAVAAIALSSVGTVVAHGLPQQSEKEGKVIVVEGNFYCNIKALTAEERARHTALTNKLMAARNETIETENGYEFQYSPDKVSVAEVAQWVVAENKCCPFFDFHIDLENQGRLVCLRLTGGAGIKVFIREEFHLGEGHTAS